MAHLGVSNNQGPYSIEPNKKGAYHKDTKDTDPNLWKQPCKNVLEDQP